MNEEGSRTAMNGEPNCDAGDENFAGPLAYRILVRNEQKMSPEF